MYKKIILFLFIPFIFGCATHQDQNIKFKKIAYHINGSGNPNGNHVFNNIKDFETAWNNAYNRTKPNPTLPQVDFNKESIIYLDFGQKTHGGIVIELKDVEVSKQTATVFINDKDLSKNPNTLTTTVMTRPFMFIKINQKNINHIVVK